MQAVTDTMLLFNVELEHEHIMQGATDNVLFMLSLDTFHDTGRDGQLWNCKIKNFDTWLWSFMRVAT